MCRSQGCQFIPNHVTQARRIKMTTNSADVIIYNGKLATQDDKRSFAQAAAIRAGKFIAVEAIAR